MKLIDGLLYNYILKQENMCTVNNVDIMFVYKSLLFSRSIKEVVDGCYDKIMVILCSWPVSREGWLLG